jgi:LPS-assembly lipoprotein
MRYVAAIAGCLLLGGCGFHPLYAVPDMPKGAMRQHLQSIYVEPVPEKLGYELRNQLIDLLDGPSEPAGAHYYLRVVLTTKSEAIGVQSQQVDKQSPQATAGLTQTAITRYNDKITAEYELVDPASNAVVAKGVETGLTSYNVLSSPYATLAVQQDADRRAAQDIADRIRIDLAVWFAQQAKR